MHESSFVFLLQCWCASHHAAANICAGTAEFVAARDIGRGEQLSISYIDTTMSYALRQQQLEWAYGFRCACDLCAEEMQQQKQVWASAGACNYNRVWYWVLIDLLYSLLCSSLFWTWHRDDCISCMQHIRTCWHLSMHGQVIWKVDRKASASSLQQSLKASAQASQPCGQWFNCTCGSISNCLHAEAWSKLESRLVPSLQHLDDRQLAWCKSNWLASSWRPLWGMSWFTEEAACVNSSSYGESSRLYVKVIEILVTSSFVDRTFDTDVNTQSETHDVVSSWWKMHRVLF